MDPRDAWHTRALEMSRALAGVTIVTTDAVLIEVLNAFAARHPLVRQRAATNVTRILVEPQIEVVSPTREDFVAALALYQDRPDKQYSLTDCMSMNLMRTRGIHEVLTHDRHFEQEGFVRLFPAQSGD
jgi:uncharacterized protein